MKVKATVERAFSPVTISITLETQKEFDFLCDLSTWDCSIPDAIIYYSTETRGNCGCIMDPNDSAYLTDFLNKIHTSLVRVKRGGEEE